MTGLQGFMAYKVGMSRLLKKDEWMGVTLLWVPNLTVLALKEHRSRRGTKRAACVGLVEGKKLRKPQQVELEKLGMPQFKIRKEFGYTSEGLKVGDVVQPLESLEAGNTFSFAGRTIGRGTAGGVKRWNFGGAPASHGTSKTERCLGSTGSRTQPGRVFKNKKMPGHYGNERVCVIGAKIVEVDKERGIVAVRGALPGKEGWLEAKRRMSRKLKA